MEKLGSPFVVLGSQKSSSPPVAQGSQKFVPPADLPPPPFNTVGFLTFTRTYARKLEDEKGDLTDKTESWEQMITRVINAANEQLHCNFTPEEQLELFWLMYHLKGLPAGRFLWSLGSKTVPRLGFQSLQNCAACDVDDPIKPFCFAMDFMMTGVGVGYNITPEKVYSMPPVKKVIVKRDDVKDADFIVPDSREGWVELLEKLLKAHFYTGKGFTYSLMLIREMGTVIKTFGGTASGGNILEKGIQLINEVINKRAGFKLRPVDALDIMNIIGMVVVAGNCRPAGTLVYTRNGLEKIEDVKIGDEVKTSTGYSRVTDVLDQGEQKLITVYTQLGPLECTPNHRLAVLTSENDFEWIEAKDLGTEDHLVFNRGVLEGSLTFLPEYKNLESNRVKDITIPVLDPDLAWFFGYFHGNGNVYNKIDGGMISIAVPSKHPHIVIKVIAQMERFGVDPKQRQTGGCIAVMGNNKNLGRYFQQFKTSWTPMNVPGFILNGTPAIRGAYLAGLFDSDGTFSQNKLVVLLSSVYPTFLTQVQSVYGSLGIPIRLKISKKAKQPEHKDLYDLYIVGKYSKDLWKELVGISSLKFVPDDYKKHIQYAQDYHFPRRWFSGVDKSQHSRYKIKSDLLSVDEYMERFGDYPKFIPVRVVSVDLTGKVDKTYDITVEENQEYFCGEGLLNHNCRRSAELALGDVNDREFLQAKRWDLGNVPNYRCYSNNSVVCNDINSLPEEFFDCYKGNGEPLGLINLGLSRKCGRLGETQYPDPRTTCFNPCAEQSLENYEVCCLGELFLPNIKSKEELFKVTKYLYRICKHSLALHCNNKEVEEVVHRNMRIGIGVTGYLSTTDQQKEWLPENYTLLREFDKQYSKKMGFAPSIKLTTVKPSGSVSLLAGVTPGGHPGFARYYIRRIRFSSESPLLKAIREHGYHVEYQKNFDGTDDRSTMVAEFPCKLPDCAVLSDEMTALQQLEVVKRLQSEWSDNAVSVTVYYRNGELPGIREWLKNNYNDCLKSVSFLLHSEHGFAQAPYEKISKEQYESMLAKSRPLVSLGFNEKGSIKADEAFISDSECVGGSCPVR